MTVFGASSLDFELRVFIPKFLDKDIVRSEFNQSIEIAFSRAKIEMPNPQMDIDLRSASMPKPTPMNFMESFWGVKGSGGQGSADLKGKEKERNRSPGG